MRYAVNGNTFPVKEQLKALGARWDAGQKKWTVSDIETLRKAHDLTGWNRPDENAESFFYLCRDEGNSGIRFRTVEKLESESDILEGLKRIERRDRDEFGSLAGLFEHGWICVVESKKSVAIGKCLPNGQVVKATSFNFDSFQSEASQAVKERLLATL